MAAVSAQVAYDIGVADFSGGNGGEIASCYAACRDDKLLCIAQCFDECFLFFLAVKTFHYYIAVRKELVHILRRNFLMYSTDIHLWVNAAQVVDEHLHLAAADLICKKELAVKVGGFDNIKVNDGKTCDVAANQVKRDIGADPTSTGQTNPREVHDAYRALTQSLYTGW